MRKHYIFSYLGLFLLIVFSGTTLNAKTRQLSSQTDSIITAYLNQVNADSLESYIQFLQDKGTRFMIAPNRREVAESIKEKFILLGADNVRIDSFLSITKINYANIKYDTTTWQYNVVATLVGITDANQCMVMGAHYDDVTAPVGDPMNLAPGADDNGSGVSALFECLRILSENNYQPVYDIEFVAFAAEELMYYGNSGAQAYVDSTLAGGRSVQLMINNDMIAYTSDDNWKISISNYAENVWLTEISESITSDYTTLEPWVRPMQYEAGADCKYFYAAGIPCVYFMEYDFNPYYHTNDDLVENANMGYCAEAVKISLGTILTVLDSTTTNLQETKNVSCKIYPNPTRGIVKIRLEDVRFNKTANLIITDLQGRILIDRDASGIEEETINLSSFPDGMYVLKLYSGGTGVTKKIMLSKH